MLQSVRRALRLSTTDPRVHTCLVRLQKYVETTRDCLATPIKVLLDRPEIKDVCFAKSSRETNEAFLESHRGSLPHALAAAKMMVVVGGDGVEKRAAETVANVKSFQTGVDLKVRDTRLILPIKTF